jgi:DNA mismatch repair protein MutL
MNRIRLLPAGISQKIAAGEVIERPVSVVKELVENSLDAGAAEIAVELVAGGKKLVRVRDDGQGMSRGDAELCFIRHSTSKIATEDDLLAISTLGFRGEALPSISAVSRMTLRTSEGGSGPGTEIEREGEDVRAVRDIAVPRGTTIDVRDLFFNLPARQKFLRGDTAELTRIVKYLTSVALAYPRLRLSASHGPRKILSCPPVGGLRERIFQLFGKSALDRLMDIDFAEGEKRLSGFVSLPPVGRPNTSHQFFFVNRRPVRDRILSSALNQAVRGILEKNLAPEAFLFLDVPYADVDVNVHPAKAEVRFRPSSDVFALVLRAVERARLKSTGIKDIAAVPARSPFGGKHKQVGLGLPSGIAEHDTFYEKTGDISAATASAAGGKAGLRVLGQLAKAYIVAEDEDGLLIVDQHNAHERVLYERYADIDRRRTWPVTISLIPLVFELTPSQTLSLEAAVDTLKESGFRVEATGGRSHALREYPDIFKPEEALSVFLSLLEEMKESPAEGRKEKILATLACKTAIKAGQPLPPEKLEFLVRELFKTSNPSLCPHGRPVVVRISKSQIEKGLRRRPN